MTLKKHLGAPRETVQLAKCSFWLGESVDQPFQKLPSKDLQDYQNIANLVSAIQSGAVPYRFCSC
jgi:hypothetical protein